MDVENKEATSLTAIRSWTSMGNQMPGKKWARQCFFNLSNTPAPFLSYSSKSMERLPEKEQPEERSGSRDTGCLMRSHCCRGAGPGSSRSGCSQRVRARKLSPPPSPRRPTPFPNIPGHHQHSPLCLPSRASFLCPTASLTRTGPRHMCRTLRWVLPIPTIHMLQLQARAPESMVRVAEPSYSISRLTSGFACL